MIAWIRNFFRGLVTEPNNSTPCVVRIIGASGALQYLGTHAYTVFWVHDKFDSQGFALGFASVLAALGVALGLKKDSP